MDEKCVPIHSGFWQYGFNATYTPVPSLPLPMALPWVGIGGAMDVAFVDEIAYALVTLVGPDVGASEVVGIYRMDGPNSFSVLADIGTWSIDNPSATPIDIPSGVQYALDAYHGGLLVTDGHLNRELLVTLDGVISEFVAFGNVVPTGLDVAGNKMHLAMAGPAPHTPDLGKVVIFDPNTLDVAQIMSGTPLLVDVEFGRGRSLYALSQGIWDGAFPGSPALPGTGSIVSVNVNNTITEIEPGLNLPTSFEIIKNTAYVVNLLGEIWLIDLPEDPPCRGARR